MIFDECKDAVDSTTCSSLCPLGATAEVDCSAQALIVLGGLLSPLVVAVICVLRCFQVNLRRPAKGRASIQDAEHLGKVNWKRVEENELKKTAIVWDVEHHEAVLAVKEVLKVEDEAPVALEIAKVVEPAAVVEFVVYSDVTFKRMYQLDAQIEYYSSTHMLWFSAKVTNVEFSAVLVPTAVNDVMVQPSRQVRTCVPLELLRFPFTEEEPCSFFSVRDDAWLPAAICGEQSPKCTTIGYKIRLVEGSQEIIAPVPAARLRTRFPSGALVEAFLDAREGWVRAIVVQEHVEENEVLLRGRWEAMVEASLQTCMGTTGWHGKGDANASNQDITGLCSSKMYFARQAESEDEKTKHPRLTPRSATQQAPLRKDGLTLCRWSLVDIALPQTGQTKTVPSFNLRHAPEALQMMRRRRLKDEQRRQEWDAKRAQEYQASERRALTQAGESV
eukprot:TRINITY_DN1400_c0_g1_i1.p1 TRINITY_DN1400_c0_g1~~TRINITY_DN1400_c0_g1_i1.p1  ORF type:complete len:446 (+),score=73.85 TRINITY_DN1400_c0_g1_i1:219-1556(+)